MREPNTRLSQLDTLWSQIHRAHNGPADLQACARQQLLERYGRPIHRYLLGALRDPAAADDLAQEFAVSFLRGSFHRADPSCGRFRDYVRTTLSRLVNRYRRQAFDQPRPLPPDLAAPAASGTEQDDLDADFLRAWREELLNRTWAALARLEEMTGRPVYLVLRLAVDHPEMRSPEMAEELNRQLGKEMSAAGARQALHRAREKFAELLQEEVAQTLEGPTPENVVEELIHLDLLRYCRPTQ